MSDDEDRRPGTNTGHGWVWARPDGEVYRCGASEPCIRCKADAARWHAVVTWVDTEAEQ